MLILDPQNIDSQNTNFALAPQESIRAPLTLLQQIEQACARVPPLWPLQNFVAVNPFVGLTGKHFLEASSLMRRVTHGEMVMPLSYYLEQWKIGRILEADCVKALEQARQTWPAAQVEALKDFSVETLTSWDVNSSTDYSATSNGAILTVADWWDQNQGTQWRAFFVDEISKWCSAYYDKGQASWRMPWRDQPLFAAWKQAALRDANPEMMGLRGFRQFVAALPDDATAVIASALQHLQVPATSTVDFLHRQLMSISGWSGYVQYQVREKGLYDQPDDSLQHLLAIRLAYEVALHSQDANLAQIWAQNLLRTSETDNSVASPELLMGCLWQLAAENAYQRGLMVDMISSPPSALSSSRRAVQAVFCIDVRSELLRRALEAQSPAIETIGFAGFFGFPIELVPFGARQGKAQCPVLLTPKFRIREAMSGASHQQTEAELNRHLFFQRLGHSWNSFKTSAVSCFSFVETGGLLSGMKLIQDSLGLSHHEHHHATIGPCVEHESTLQGDEKHPHFHLQTSGMSVEEQIAVAANALKHMGLTQNLARLVMICGHGSTTANNPYGSGLDCGACGGHSGEANARVAAIVLNHELVREGLKSHGIVIPEDTHFIAALHNTTTDEVTLFDEGSIPITHSTYLTELKQQLKAASEQTRQERAASLGLAPSQQSSIHAEVRTRSRDWAQTRPEWGLAGNAAFIAAPRERTQALNLGGRAFLNNYDFKSDPDGSKLELVMTAPMVVASWINWQYFASTVNNLHFGSGNKTIHNVVGTFGVWQGNCGDLQVGLPLQSVHDGHKWRHEPLRLSVFIEAPHEAISAVIEKHDSVRELLDNGWLHLISIEENGRNFMRYCGKGQWDLEDISHSKTFTQK